MSRRNTPPSSVRMLQGVGLATLAMAALTSQASSQVGEGPYGRVRADSLEGVVRVDNLGDGRIRMVLEDGRTVTLDAADVSITDRGIFVDAVNAQAAIADLAPVAVAGGGAGGGAMLGLLGGVGLLGAAAGGGGGGGGGSTPTPVPPTPPSNTAPTITSDGTASVAENSTAVLTATGSDADGDALSWSISGGSDAGLFAINASTGALSFVTAPDFEAPADSGGDNVYTLTIAVSDGTDTTTQTVTVTVTDVDEAPAFQSGASASVTENTSGVVYTAEATDAEGADVSYSLGGTDAALFSINAASGELSFLSPPDFENPEDADADNVYDITVVATDGSQTSEHGVSITVTDVNDTGAAITGQPNSYAGGPITSIGDIDGDGLDDVLVGSMDNATEIGTVHIVTGASLTGDADGVIALPAGGLTITGFDANAGAAIFGEPRIMHLSNAGDVDGDGRDDLLINNYLVWGSAIAGATGPIDLSTPGDWGVELAGTAGAPSFPFVRAAGDVDGDGHADILVAEGYFNGTGYTINTWLLSGADLAGQTGGPLDVTTFGDDTIRIVPGGYSPDNATIDLHGIGDFDNDGIGDFALTEPTNSPSRTILISGAGLLGDADGVVNIADLIATGFSVQSSAFPQDLVGDAVIGLGDLDGDGFDEVAIAATHAQSQANQIFGEVYVMWGSAVTAAGTGSVATDAADFSDYGVRLIGLDISTNGNIGEALANAGDVDGDGIDDLLIGAPGAGAPNAWLVFGSALVNDADGVIDLNNLGDAGVRLTNVAAWTVSTAGDVSGDGLADILIGAPLADGGAGAAFYLDAQYLLSDEDGVIDLQSLFGVAPLTTEVSTEDDKLPTMADFVLHDPLDLPENSSGFVPLGAVGRVLIDAGANLTRSVDVEMDNADPSFVPVADAIPVDPEGWA